MNELYTSVKNKQKKLSKTLKSIQANMGTVANAIDAKLVENEFYINRIINSVKTLEDKLLHLQNAVSNMNATYKDTSYMLIPVDLTRAATIKDVELMQFTKATSLKYDNITMCIKCKLDDTLVMKYRELEGKHNVLLKGFMEINKILARVSSQYLKELSQVDQETLDKYVDLEVTFRDAA